jgi:hypothetical protein
MWSGFSKDVECVEEESEYCVLEMARNGGDFVYFLEKGKQTKWVCRDDLVKDHPQALIDFY